ncbi:MAG: VWA domain-containing protein, partial [Planctomycetes bacterium]|nr:VWA domain-containing protein [Planctomycetota bacterium]
HIFPNSLALAGSVSRRTHKILVLDGSFSMALKDGDGKTCFDRARAAAAQVVQESPSGDGFSVVLLSAPPRRIVPEPSDDAGKVVKEIENLRLPHGNADLAAGLSTIEDLLRPEKSPRKFEEREVYFFTDMQRSTWTSRPSVDPTSSLEKIRARAHTIFVDVGRPEATDNLAVTNLVLDAPLATTGTDTAFTATVHNYGKTTRQQVRMDFLVGKARASANDLPFEPRVEGQKVFTVTPDQSEAVTFQYKFKTAGEYAVQVRLENDSLDLDDVRSIVLAVKDSVPVMLVNGKPDPDPLNQATEWLHLALNPYLAGLVPGNIPARPRVVSDADFLDAGLGDLTPYDCVYLCDVRLLTPAEVRRLETHLRRGGGVVITLGPNVDLEAYNRLLYRNGEGILPGRLLGFQEAPDQVAFSLYTDEENSDRPPLKAFTGNFRADLLASHFRKYVRVELPPRSSARKVLTFMPEALSLDKGLPPEPLPVNDPALIEWPRFRGRVVLLTSTVNCDWTSWPISPRFPELMQELLRYVIAGRLREQAAAVGEPLEEYLPVSNAGLDGVIHAPNGQAESTRTLDRDEAGVLRWTDTDVSGLYRATLGNSPQDHLFAVNVPTATEGQQACESDLTRTSREELRSAYPGWDFQIVNNLTDVAHVGGSADDEAGTLRDMGTVIARDLLLAMLVLLVLEVVLAWRFGHYSSAAGLPGAPPSGRLVPLLVGGALAVLFCVLAGVLVHAAWTGDFCGFLPERFRRTVEMALGIPPPAPGEGTRWRLDFSSYLWDANADPWLAGLIAVALAALVVFIYLQEGRTSSVAYKLLLAGLRVGFVLLTLAVLLPQLRLWFERQGWPDVAILIDNSRSMSATDRYQDERVRQAADRLGQVAGLSAPERLQLAKALLTHDQGNWVEALLKRRKVKVHLYDCSGRAARLPNGDVTDAANPRQLEAALQDLQGLRAEGETSQLGTAVRQVLNDFRGSSLAAVIMLTDGVTTEGDDLVKAGHYATQMGVPLFFVGVGDAHEVRDLKLHDLQVEDSVYVNDRIIFEGRLTGQGYSDLTVPVTLREKGSDKILDRQMVKIDPQGKPVKFRLTHQAAEPGEKIFIIEVPVQPDEVQPGDNNRLERTVFVRETRLIKVLYVEGNYRWEFQKIKTLLERESAQDPRNKTIDLKVLLLGAEDDWAKQDKSAIVNFPPRAELNQFDVVIFGDVDPTDARVERHLKDVADFVRERGGGFLMIAGPFFSPNAYKDTPLADILPIEIASPEPPDEDRAAGYRPELTPVGRFHPIFRFSPTEAENAGIWNSLAEIYWYAQGYRARWGAEVLAVHPKVKAPAPATNAGNRQPAGDDRLPLMVQQFVGAGRSMFFGLDETWRWGFREDLLRFNQFWIQTVRYLSRSRLGRIELRLDRQTPYRRGEPIKITVRFPDDAPPPAPETEVKVKVVRTLHPPGGLNEIEEETVALAKVEGSRATYEAQLTRTPEGDYTFNLSSPLVEGYRPRADCRVVAPPGEMDRLRMNQQDMERAAEESGGHFYTLADAGNLLNDLPSGTRVALNAPQPPRLLWNHLVVFALALGLLGTEWFLRKRKHLL